MTHFSHNLDGGYLPGLWVIRGQCCPRVAAAPSLPNGPITQLSPYFTRKPGKSWGALPCSYFLPRGPCAATMRSVHTHFVSQVNDIPAQTSSLSLLSFPPSHLPLQASNLSFLSSGEILRAACVSIGGNPSSLPETFVVRNRAALQLLFWSSPHLHFHLEISWF